MTDGLPPEILEPDMNEQGNIIVPKVTRAEWIAAIALLLNVMTIAFVAGQVMQTQNDQSRRIDQLEETDRSLIPRVERIDANVQFLAEQAREQRQRGNGR